MTEAIGINFQLVVAIDSNSGIGKDGALPWKLPGDMAYFRELTSKTRGGNGVQNCVIMGRKTWDSIPTQHRPLKGRINIVLSRSFENEENDGGAGGNGGVGKSESLASSIKDSADTFGAGSLESALELLTGDDLKSKIETVFVIGGGQVYKEAIASPACSAIHLTRIDKDYQCDAFFPAIDTNKFKVWSASQPMQAEDGTRFTFMCYTSARGEAVPLPPAVGSRHDELQVRDCGGTAAVGCRLLPARMISLSCMLLSVQYLELVDRVIRTGVYRPDRTGTGTYSLFGSSMRFDLRHSFPLLTTKRVFWRGGLTKARSSILCTVSTHLDPSTCPFMLLTVSWSFFVTYVTLCHHTLVLVPPGVMEELLWFVKGSTNARLLQDKGVHIWDGNSSKEFLESRGLGHREEGDLGPVYGFQWRHFGAEYKDMHTDYSGECHTDCRSIGKLTPSARCCPKGASTHGFPHLCSGQGVDQLADVIHKIKTNPCDRRILLTAWNPAALHLMALPPCHMFCQVWQLFYVAMSCACCAHFLPSNCLFASSPNVSFSSMSQMASSRVSCTSAPATSASGFPSTLPRTPCSRS